MCTKFRNNLLDKTTQKCLLSVGELNNGEHFQLRRNGKWYTVHCQVISKPSDEIFDKMSYTLAVSGRKMYVFDDRETGHHLPLHIGAYY